MTIDEWALLLLASDKSQLPALRTALGLTTLFQESPNESLVETPDPGPNRVQNHVLAKIIRTILMDEASVPSKEGCVVALLHTFATARISLETIKAGLYNDFGQFKDGKNSNTSSNYHATLDMLQSHLTEEPTLPSYSNAPFSFERLQAALDSSLFYEEANGNKQIRDYCSQLVMRLKSISENPDFEFLRASTGELQDYDREPTYFVDRLLGIEWNGADYRKVRQLCIIDLNDASDEIVELTSAVVARSIFDRMRRASPRNRMPAHLILEEAHRYISERPSRFDIDAGMTFERIAKEGRKYGAFLLRVSDLLCNWNLVHAS